MKKLFLCAATLLFLFPTPLSAAKNENTETVIVHPVDEAAQDPDFFTFRRNLVNALIARDDAFVKSMIAPDIKFSFGDDHGIERFLATWQSEGTLTNDFYATMLDVLLGGGAFLGDQFCAPYTYTADKTTDPFDEVIVIDKDAPVYSAPNAQQEKPVAHVSYEVLKIDRQWNLDGDWQPVILSSGKSGYISTDDIRSPIDYRACFGKHDGTYMMDILIAGD